MKTWPCEGREIIPFLFPVGQGTIPVGPSGLASSIPAKPGPDGPGYYLTALRALCVAHHGMGTDRVLLSPDEW